jgi:hypothetical protein
MSFVKQARGGLNYGTMGAIDAEAKLRAAGMSEEEIDEVTTLPEGTLRGILKPLGYGALGGIPAAALFKGKAPGLLGAALGGAYGTYRSYQDEIDRADEALEALEKQSSVKQAYIMGMHQAFIDSGRLVQLPFEKMAQAAQIADAATPEEVQLVGSQITSQDISSLAKILGVLTELQQKFLENGGGPPPMDPSMMGPPPMDPSMMGPPPMDPSMMGPPPMGPPPMGPPPGAMPPPM